MQIYTSWTQNRLNSSGWKLLSFKHRTFSWKKAGGKHSQFSKRRKMFRNISSGSYTFKIFVDLLTLFAAKSLQLCLTLCDPIDSSSPGSPVPGILQIRTLEWVAISFSNAWKVKLKSFNLVWLSATPWIAAYQAPPSMEYSRQKHWSGFPLPLGSY